VSIPNPKVKIGTTGIFEFEFKDIFELLEFCAKKIKNTRLKYSNPVSFILVGSGPLVMNPL
jgi:hypothetical protein